MAMNFDPFRELDRVASALLENRQGPRQMPMDLYREGDRYILNAELPGIDPGSVDIDVDGDLLTIRAERNVRGSEGVRWLVRERQNAQFLRQLNLGRDIDIEGITAHYDNGVLNVVIPVSERAKPRRIAVSEGSIQSSVEAGSAEQQAAGTQAVTGGHTAARGQTVTGGEASVDEQTGSQNAD